MARLKSCRLCELTAIVVAAAAAAAAAAAVASGRYDFIAHLSTRCSVCLRSH